MKLILQRPPHLASAAVGLRMAVTGWVYLIGVCGCAIMIDSGAAVSSVPVAQWWLIRRMPFHLWYMFRDVAELASAVSLIVAIPVFPVTLAATGAMFATWAIGSGFREEGSLSRGDA